MGLNDLIERVRTEIREIEVEVIDKMGDEAVAIYLHLRQEDEKNNRVFKFYPIAFIYTLSHGNQENFITDLYIQLEAYIRNLKNMKAKACAKEYHDYRTRMNRSISAYEQKMDKFLKFLDDHYKGKVIKRNEEKGVIEIRG